MTSTRLPDAHPIPTAYFCMSAATAVPAASRSGRAPNRPTTVVPEPQPTETGMRSSKPVPSSPIDGNHLQYQLSHQPNRDFAHSLISM